MTTAGQHSGGRLTPGGREVTSYRTTIIAAGPFAIWRPNRCTQIDQEPPGLLDKVCTTTQTGPTITALFPDEPGDISMGIGQFLNDQTPNPGEHSATKTIVPMLTGCVDYKFGSSPRHHQTGFVYTLSKAQNRTRFFPIGETLADAQIVMTREHIHDRAN